TPAISPVERPSGGLRMWLTTVDHKKIGIMYLVTTLAFFLIGGLMALIIRLQLASDDGKVVSAENYDRLFTMHGTTMIFLFVVPVMAPIGNSWVPLEPGAMAMPFPKMTAASYWLFLFGGRGRYSPFLSGGPPNAGGTSSPPLSEISAGHGIDF